MKNLLLKNLLLPTLLVAMVPCLFLTSSANATPINGATTGLSSPQSTITFSENPFTPIINPANPNCPCPPPIGTAYSGLGVTFSANVGYATENMYAPNVPNFSGDAAVNFSGDGHWLITFNTLLKEVAFAYGSDGSGEFGLDPTTTTFAAWRNGSIVEQFSADTIFGTTNNIFGFRNILFDQIVIDAGPGRDFGNGIDNLQFSAVPEPSSLVLLGLGLAGLAASRRFSFIKSRSHNN